MRDKTSTFGLLSGLTTFLGLIPHLLFLSFILLFNWKYSLFFLIVSSIGAKFFAEWFFWNSWQNRISSITTFKNWRDVINIQTIKHPNILISLMAIIADLSIDSMLIYKALQMTIHPVWIFFTFLFCQALASPVQGILSDFWSRKKTLLFSLFFGGLVLIAVSSNSTDASSALNIYSIFDSIGLPFLSPSVQIALVLCAKGLLGNSSVLARAAIADVLKVEAIRKLGKA